MPLYTAVKSFHIACATLSAALFLLRGAWRFGAPERLAARWVRILPHVIDTALLLSALWLAWQLGGAGTQGWLAAKVVALVAYIALGMVALKRGRTPRVRAIAFVLACLTFAYIVSVALTKSPWGPLAFA